MTMLFLPSHRFSWIYWQSPRGDCQQCWSPLGKSDPLKGTVERDCPRGKKSIGIAFRIGSPLWGKANSAFH